MAAATLDSLETDVEAAITVAGVTAADGSNRLEQRLARSVVTGFVKIVDAEQITIDSNVSRWTAEVEVKVGARAAGGTVAQAEAAEDVARGLIEDLTLNSFWTDISSISPTPKPEISVAAEPERVGEVVTFTLRASCVLELEV